MHACECMYVCVHEHMHMCIGWPICPHFLAGHLEWAVCFARRWSQGPRRLLAWKGTSGATGLQTAMSLTLLRPGLCLPWPIFPTTTTSPLSPPALPSLMGAPSGPSQVSSVAGGRHGLDPGEGKVWTCPWEPPALLSACTLRKYIQLYAQEPQCEGETALSQSERGILKTLQKEIFLVEKRRNW